jgi:hypothetical protein
MTRALSDVFTKSQPQNPKTPKPQKYEIMNVNVLIDLIFVHLSFISHDSGLE